MLTCLSCGRENPDDARFCNGCGYVLTATPAAREQRKTVTVLFCDVSGSTALGERLDPEPLRALLADYFERMKAIVERHGGSVEKFIGDAVMAVFGVPVLHEDDALRAVRAAVMRQNLRVDEPVAKIAIEPGIQPIHPLVDSRPLAWIRRVGGRAYLLGEILNDR